MSCILCTCSVSVRAPYRAGPLVGLSVGLGFGPGRVETFNPIILSGRVSNDTKY